MRRSGTTLRHLVAAAFVMIVAAGPGMARKSVAAEPYDIHVILPLTGRASFVGKGQQQMLEALEGSLNKEGGIQGRPVHFIYHDDQTSPQVSVQLAQQILATHPSVYLGSSIVAMCNAVAPLVKNGPVMYCLSPGVHPKPRSYEFSASVSTFDLMTALIRYYRLEGWTRLAMISSTDATGQDVDRGIADVLKMPENRGVTLVRHEHFDPSDVSVAAQMERIKAAHPQALIAWTTGAAIATIFKGAVQVGLDVPVGTTNGNQTFAQMKQYAAFLPKQLYIPSSLFPEHDGVYTLDPRVEKVQHDMYAVLKAQGLRPDNMAGTSWDAALIVVDTLRHLGLKATPAEIRSRIAGITDFAGINGIYDFKKYPQRGLGAEEAIVTRWEPQKESWVWVSKPGGAPLGH